MINPKAQMMCIDRAKYIDWFDASPIECCSRQAIEQIYISMVNGKSDKIASLFSIIDFLYHTTDIEAKNLCEMFSFIDIWEYLSNQKLQKHAILCLSQVSNYKNHDFFSFITYDHIDCVFGFLSSGDSDVVQSAELFLGNICDYSSEFLFYVLNKGITKKLELLDSSYNFSILLINLLKEPNDYVESIVNLVSYVINSDDYELISNGLHALGRALHFSVQDKFSHLNDTIFEILNYHTERFLNLGDYEIQNFLYSCLCLVNSFPEHLARIIIQNLKKDKDNSFIIGIQLLESKKDSLSSDCLIDLYSIINDRISSLSYIQQKRVLFSFFNLFSNSTEFSPTIVDTLLKFANDTEIGSAALGFFANICVRHVDSPDFCHYISEFETISQELIGSSSEESQIQIQRLSGFLKFGQDL